MVACVAEVLLVDDDDDNDDENDGDNFGAADCRGASWYSGTLDGTSLSSLLSKRTNNGTSETRGRGLRHSEALAPLACEALRIFLEDADEEVVLPEVVRLPCPHAAASFSPCHCSWSQVPQVIESSMNR